MWKKILYFLLVIILGFGITMISGSINFNAQAKSLIKGYAKNHDYEMVERFFCYVTTDTSSYFASKDNDSIHYDVYPCLVKHPYYMHYSDGSINVAYDVVEEAIGFTFFSLPKSFSYKDKGINRGEVKITLSNDQIIDLYFLNIDKEYGDMNFYIDFYSFVSSYSSLSIYITRYDYYSFANADDIYIKEMELIDGNGVSYIKNNVFEKNPNFQDRFFNDYLESTNNYYDFMEEFGTAVSEGVFKEKDRLLKEIDKITSSKDIYHPKPSKNIILNTNSFILTISLTLAIYLSIAIVVTRLIFFRKR